MLTLWGGKPDKIRAEKKQKRPVRDVSRRPPFYRTIRTGRQGRFFQGSFHSPPFYRTGRQGQSFQGYVSSSAVLSGGSNRKKCRKRRFTFGNIPFQQPESRFCEKSVLYQGFSRGGKAGVPARQQNFRFFRRQRSGKQVALDNIASQIAQNFKILFIFNAFRQYG